MNYTIELFDKKELITGDTVSPPDGGGGETEPPVGNECNGIKNFLNEGIVTVDHSCNSMYLDITVYNSDNKKIGAAIAILSQSQFQVSISPSTDGYVIWEKIK